MPGKRELITEPNAAGEPAAINRTAKTGLWLIPAIVALALVLALAIFCGIAAARDTIAPHTAVGATDVSGLTRAQATERITAALDAMRRSAGVHALLESGEEAAYFSYEELGVAFDAQALAEDAYDSSHSGSLIADGWTLLRAMLGTQTEIAPAPDEGWTVDAARRIADAAELTPEDFAYEVTDDNRLFMTRPRDGRSVDAKELRARLVDAETDENGSRTVTLPCAAVPADTGDLADINEKLGGEMANASYDKATGAIIPERMALNFDLAAAKSLLDAAAPGETIQIPAELSEPEITAEELRSVLFRDVLGTYTTRVGGAPGRRSNVRLTASRVNGTILNSGEEFNYYALTGPFSAANGYQSAPGYLHGKTVDMDGGGACQCSSTTYAAALLANLEIVARTAHGFASDYIGLGLDATVSGGGPDFIFRNNTPYPIKVTAVYSDNNRLTVSIIGTKTDSTTVKMRTEVLSTTPYEEEVITDPTLAPGARVVDTTPYTGYLVNTYRQLYDGEGKLISETFEARSKYNKRNRIIKVGPAVEQPATQPAVPAQNTAPVETTPPAGTTTPPVETTPPAETTPPVETTPPAETAPPVETTPPAETAPPAVSTGDIPALDPETAWVEPGSQP